MTNSNNVNSENDSRRNIITKSFMFNELFKSENQNIFKSQNLNSRRTKMAFFNSDKKSFSKFAATFTLNISLLLYAIYYKSVIIFLMLILQIYICNKYFISKFLNSLVESLRKSSKSFSMRQQQVAFMGNPSSKVTAILITFFMLVSLVESVDVFPISVKVPPHKESGKSVELECEYDLGNNELYSVKWYRNSNEFFRYVPAENPKIQVFYLPGVVVDVAFSDATKVTLRSVTRASSGKYKCEVSADSPSFHTVSETSEMLVVDLPRSVPNITGSRLSYHVGDEVHVNCTSEKSRPAASLIWYINDRQARTEELVEYAPVQDEDGLETSRLGLKFIVGAQDFPEGCLKIRCTATIAAVYWQSSEQGVEGQLPQTSPALESKGVYAGGSSSTDLFTSDLSTLFWLQAILIILNLNR